MRNVGLRDVIPALVPLVAAQLSISPSGTNVALRWTSVLGLTYLPQSTSDFVSWTSMTNGVLPGTGSDMIYTDSAAATGGKFYRLLIGQQ